MKNNFKSYTKTIIIISSMISICLVLFIAFSANYYISQMSKNNSELYSAYRISELMKSFKNGINVLESKQRGYIVTGDGKFLEAYKEKERETKTYLKSMEKYFSQKPEEEAFYKLKELTYKKLMESKDLAGNQNMIGLSGQNSNLQETGINTISEINNTVDAINDSLSKTTKILLDNSEEYVGLSKKWSYLEIALGIITALAAVIFLITDINSRNKLQDELRIAKKQADENAIMKEQFMANMSHEIRTPMNAILGFSDLLQKTTLDKTQLEYLLAVQNSGTNLLNIINDILDFSKLEAGKLNIEKIQFNIVDLLNSLKVMFAQKAIDKQILFGINIDEKTPSFVFGDPTRLTQILTNLVNNAIKFTSHGNVTLSCDIKSIEHDVVQFVFKIKDSGIGIPADKIDTIFERFNQGNAETTRKFGGTGLGLAIVKQLVEIQNGTINFISKEGLGTEFTVKIRYPISYETKIIQSEKNSGEFKIISTKPLFVLLTEDNVLNQILATTYLTGFGLNVDIAENGIVALEKLKYKNYDLVLMDIQMPLLDGYTATNKIREELGLMMPIIAMTANVMPDEREKCASYGMNDYISKPFKEVDLFNIVKSHIGNKSESKLKEDNGEVINKKQASVLDFEHLQTLSRGNQTFIKEIVEIFLQQNPIEIKELELAISDKNYPAIRAISHKMKTSVGFIGINQLLPILTNIENFAITEGDINSIEYMFSNVKALCNQANIELKSIV